MSKRLKRNIAESFQKVKEAVKSLECKKQEAVSEVLQMMQETIISIGNTIEQYDTETEAVVKHLENLAEMVYELSLGENYRDLHKCEEMIAGCENAESEIEKLLPVCEILFMPYKAAMWDAMESIYFAAASTPDCSVHVMPVPYYHLAEGRMELEMEYEGDMFPKEIPITDYRNYKLSVMQPDVILIHNPYDDKNRVTSLPECYFSSELKKYTDRLVYIPYKVCNGAVNDMYCVLPGVKNAWRVYVQSPQVRDVYLKYNLPEKIVTVGSPKIDKIVDSQKHIPEIPNEWKCNLQNRTVFLLNTHLNHIINDTENMLRGLEQIIEVFKTRKTAVVLWRPHPLSIETLEALKPDMLEKYRQTVKNFKKLENGIYDETPEPHLAIALAEAYIGDCSSMVTLFGATGKPVFIRNVDLQLQENSASQKSCLDQKALAEASRERKPMSIYYEEILTLEAYVDMILRGEDILKPQRKEEFEKIVYDISGNVGKNIWDDIYKECNK